jgi:hypothetical protein
MRRRSRQPGAAASVVPADVPAALDVLGLDYALRGDEAVALCPAPGHRDRTPSWSVNIRTGQHHCFSCGYGGSFVSLAATVQGTGYDQAAVWARTLRVQESLDGEEIVTAARERRAAEVRESDLWLCGDPPAGELAGRGITLEAARACEVLWHRDKHCWVFPVRDPVTDALLGWQEKSDRRFVNRPPGLDKHRSLFGLRHVKATGRSGLIVVVESPLDVARFIAAGIERAVATYGIEFTDEQIAVLWDWADEIILAGDNDMAGQRKIARWLAEHPEDRAHCKVFSYGQTYQDRDFRGWHIHPEGDRRDPGNLTDQELRDGVRRATPGLFTIFEAVG